MNLESVCEFAGGGERFLSYSFEQARKSLFPLGKSKFFPNQKHSPKSPWPGMSMTSLIEGDQSEAMLKILKEQHAYVISQHNYLMRTQADTEQAQASAQQVATQTAAHAESQAQQMELVRDVLSSFQDSMAMMMQLTTEMVTKACEVNAVVPAAPIVASPLPPPPSFEKSAVSHRRPVIQDIPTRDPVPVEVNAPAKPVTPKPIEPAILKSVSNDGERANNISRVQPHPISKKLERIKKD